MIFEVQNIAKKFKSDLLKSSHQVYTDLSFRLEEGKITGFLGLNGQGKTTLIKILFGFLKADKGKVSWIPNKDMKKVGYLPERPIFYPEMSGNEFICFMGTLNGLQKHEIKEFIKREITVLGVDFDLNIKIKEMSKGMVQKVGFLSSYVNHPKLLILDEPLSGLDPLSRRLLKNKIKDLNDSGSTVFFSSHIVTDVEEICQNILIINSSEKVYDGSIKQLQKSYVTDEFWLKADTMVTKEYAPLEIKGEEVKYKNTQKHEILQYMQNNNIELNQLRPHLIDLEQIILNLRVKK